MAPQFGPKNVAEIRGDYLADLANAAAQSGVTEDIGPGTDNYAQGTAVAGVAMLLHARIDGNSDAITPNTATGEDLLRWKGALGLPDVNASNAGGKITIEVLGGGTATIPDGQPGTINGNPFTVINGPWSSILNGADVDVLMGVVGEVGNARQGTPATLLNPPANVSADAKVSRFFPIVGGYDEENQPRLRERVLNRMGTNPGGGNWGQLREIAYETSPGVQQAFVYPAVAGAATDKLVVLKSFDREFFNFSRIMPDAVVTQVRGNVHAIASTGLATIVSATTDEPADVAIQLAIPDSRLSGGNGSGWLDVAPWPLLEGGNTRVTVTSNTNGVLVLAAATTTAPIEGQTRIAWWSPTTCTFYVRTVMAVSGSAGAWSVTLDVPFVDDAGEKPVAGDFISPGAENLVAYGTAWLDLMEILGSGENTNNADLVLHGRALRHPFTTEQHPHSLNISQMTALRNRFTEIEQAQYSYRSVSSPTLPATVEDQPNVLVPRNFGVYPL